MQEYLCARHSVRDFQDKEVPQEVLHQLIEVALQSPSGSNAQPYRIAIATGATKHALKEKLSRNFTIANQVKSLPLPKRIYKGFVEGIIPDSPFKPEKVHYDEELFARKRACGMGLYDTLGIAREDREARNQQMLKNYEFFGAPVVLFIFANTKMQYYGALDAGIFMQSLMLAALDFDLGTCAQAALGIWEAPLREHFNVGENYGLLCGMSLGYPSDHEVNQFRTTKRTLDEVLIAAK